MAIENGIDCFYTGTTLSVNFNNNVINVGEFWYTTDNTDPNKAEKPYCAEITSSSNEPTSNLSAFTEYATCYDCWANNYGVFIFDSCSGNLGIPLVIDISAVTPTFFSTYNLSQSYYIECEIVGVPLIGCFSVSEKRSNPILLSKTNYDAISLQLQSVGAEIVNNIIGITAFTACVFCLNSSPIVYEVKRCYDGSTDYVQLPNNSFSSELISYTDGVDEFCGFVQGISQISVPSYTFVNSYGLEGKCDVCLDVSNNKYLITNCVDSNIQEVVWGSQLFQNGSVSNLQFGGGCYEVSGQTTDLVTLNLLLDFEPQPTCQSCLECNGIFYEYALCSEPSVKVGEILSYQIIPVGGIFYHPNYNDFVVRLNAIPTNTTTYETFYSLVTEASCGALLPIVQVWRASICNTLNEVFVTTSFGFNVNDITQTLWGDNNFLCVELLEDVTGAVSQGTFLNTNGTQSLDCLSCENNTTIGIRTINCYTQEVEVVDLPYSSWTQVTNYGGFGGEIGFPYNCFLDSNGFCRTITEICPVTPTGNLVDLNQQYLNCPICVTFNPRPIPLGISAGTEYFACQVCCPCTSGGTVTSVSVPHPIWTGIQGNSITLLDAVQLGGMNGLNS